LSVCLQAGSATKHKSNKGKAEKAGCERPVIVQNNKSMEDKHKGKKKGGRDNKRARNSQGRDTAYHDSFEESRKKKKQEGRKQKQSKTGSR